MSRTDAPLRSARPQPFPGPPEPDDPHRHLEAERRGHRVLAMRAAREQDVLGALGEIGERGQDRGQLTQKDFVRPSHLKQLARLGDVLRRRAPVHVAARIALAPGATEVTPDNDLQALSA